MRLTGYGAHKAYLWVYKCIFSLHKVANRHASGVWHGCSMSASCHLMTTACISYLLLVKWVKVCAHGTVSMYNEQILTQAAEVGDPALSSAPFNHVLHLCYSLLAKHQFDQWVSHGS